MSASPHPPKPLQQTTLDGRLARLQTVIDGGTHDGRDGLFLGKGRLPIELFLLTIAHLEDWRDVVLASHVAVYWRKAIVNHAELWTELEYLDPALLESVDRARVVAERSKGRILASARGASDAAVQDKLTGFKFAGGLRVLTMDVNASGELALDSLPVLASTRQVLREISKAGAHNLKTLSLDLMGYRFVEDHETPYNLVALLASFVQHSAVNLRTLSITSELPRYPSGAPFLSNLPDLHELTLTSDNGDPASLGIRLPDFLTSSASFAESQITSCALRSLTLSGSSLTDPTYPSLPNLETIKLYDVKCSNLFALLSSSKPVTLWLLSVHSEPPSKFSPAPANDAPKDATPILALPYLKDLQICGESPLLWNAPTSTTADFMTEVPQLRNCSFGEQEVFDEDAACDRGESSTFDSVQRLTAENLSSFFRTATNITTLDLSGTNVNTQMLSTSLTYSASSLTTLNLRSTGITDALIDQLHSLVPSLSKLDVRNPEGRVTIPALARMANRLRTAAPMRRWLGAFRLRIIADRPFPTPSSIPNGNPTPTLATITTELRNALAVLSTTQVNLLASSSLVLNDPPNALQFSVCKPEIISLSTQNFPKGTEASGDPKKARLPASQTLVDVAKAVMVRWQQRRENEWAIEWCKDNGVKLSWNLCEVEGCECPDDHDEE